jgi:hypothetical protein
VQELAAAAPGCRDSIVSRSPSHYQLLMIFDLAWDPVFDLLARLACRPLPLLAEISSASCRLASSDLSGFAPRLAVLLVKKLVVCDPLLRLLLWFFSQKQLLVNFSLLSRHELNVRMLPVVMTLLVYEIAGPSSSVATRLDLWLTRRRQPQGDRVFSFVREAI